MNSLQDTAAKKYGVKKERVPENLVKINVYYTSLNEKLVEDMIDYNLEVRYFEHFHFLMTK